jgi:hypothetical protein
VPRVVLECDFRFSSGESLRLDGQEGRDAFAADDARFKITLKPDELTVEEHTIHRDKLDYSKIVRRVLPDE